MSKKSKRIKHNSPADPSQKSGESDRCKYSDNPHVTGEIEFRIPQSLENKHDTERREDATLENKKLLVERLMLIAVVVYSAFTFWLAITTRDAAKSAEKSAKTAQQQLELSERPWVKFKPRILTMAFNSKFFRVESAVVTIEDTFENVGPTVALNVAAWEDVFPLDATFYRTAMARQKELCDMARHPDPKGVTGYFLFPKDPFVNHSIVGPPMNLVTQAKIKTPQGDKVGFVLVGCVSYRAPFEAIDAPRHQTRYVYLLGRTGSDGIFNTGVEPTGTAIGLEVAALPDGLSAD